MAFLLVFLAHTVYYVDIDWAHLRPAVFHAMFAIHGAGYYGVDLFFVLSSYLITELLLQEREQTGSIHLRQFYIRRILRIWPLYFFFLLLVLPIAGRFVQGQHLSTGVLASFLLLVGNWHCVWFGWPPTVASQLWSVTVEEQFYLLWPPVLRRWPRLLPSMAAGMLVVANMMRVYLVQWPRNDAAIWCNTLARLDPIAGGILLAWALHGRPDRMRGISRPGRMAMMAAGAALLLLVGNYGDHTDWRAMYSYQGAALGCVLLVRATLVPEGRWKPGPVGRGIIYLGRISYGLYVFHLLAFELVHQWWPRQPVVAIMTEVMLLSIGMAALSYRLLEMPFLRLKQRFTLVRSRDSLQ